MKQEKDKLVAGMQTPFHLTTGIEVVIRKNKLLTPNQSAIIALSGGQDSISIWFSLLQLKEPWGLILGLLYFQHLWQPASLYVFSQLIGLALLSEEPLFAPIVPFSIPSEEIARQWRYQAAYRIGRFYGFQGLVLGHTTSDSIETFLLSLMRGSRKSNRSNLALSRWNNNSYPNSLALSFFSKIDEEKFEPLEARAIRLLKRDP